MSKVLATTLLNHLATWFDFILCCSSLRRLCPTLLSPTCWLIVVITPPHLSADCSLPFLSSSFSANCCLRRLVSPYSLVFAFVTSVYTLLFLRLRLRLLIKLILLASPHLCSRIPCRMIVVSGSQAYHITSLPSLSPSFTPSGL